jgi:hypothetical protein
MTTYQYMLRIGGSEYDALSEALKLMISHCNEQISSGESVPYYAHRQTCQELLAELRDKQRRMNSTWDLSRTK